MPSIYYTLCCLLCYVAVMGQTGSEDAMAQTAAPAGMRPDNESLIQVPMTTMEQPALKLDAEQPTTTLGAMETVTKLEEASQSMAENKTAAQEIETRKPDVPENQTEARACADKVLINGAGQLEPDCTGFFYKTAIKPSKNHSFKPIYRNKKGKHLYFWAPAGNWIVETDGSYTSPFGVMFSHADTMCPEDAGSHDKWKIWDQDFWTNWYPIVVKAASGTAEGNHDPAENEEEDDEEDDEEEEEQVEPKQEDDVEIVRDVVVVSEPSSENLMRLPLLAALFSFTGVLGYSCLFLCKMWKRVGGSSPKGKATNHANKEPRFEDLEGGCNIAMSTKALGSEAVHFPVVRKQVHANDEVETGAKRWDKDLEGDASWGDNAWDADAWDNLEGIAA